MRIILFLLLSASFCFTICGVKNPVVTEEKQSPVRKETVLAADKSPVLVELFTSEG